MSTEPIPQSLIDRVLQLHEHEKVPLTIAESDIADAEKWLNATLPSDFRSLLLALNGISFNLWELLRVVPARRDASKPRAFQWPDIVTSNEWVHRNWEMPDRLVALVADGTGDYICFDPTAAEKSGGVIVHWSHDEPVPDEEILPFADSFLEWLQSDLDEREKWGF